MILFFFPLNHQWLAIFYYLFCLEEFQNKVTFKKSKLFFNAVSGDKFIVLLWDTSKHIASIYSQPHKNILPGTLGKRSTDGDCRAPVCIRGQCWYGWV